MSAKRISAICLVSALALIVAMFAGGAGATMSSAVDQSWTDPAGDAAGGAPDLTAVQVSNDEAGRITLDVTVPMVTDTAVIVFLDTDLNGRYTDATGRVIAGLTLQPGIIVPMVMDGLGDPVSIASLQMSATATTVEVSFLKTDVGIDSGFAFWIATATDAQMVGEGPGDEMPDTGMFTYTLTTPPPPTTTPAAPLVVKPIIGKPVTTPKVATAGKRFTVKFVVTRSDTGTRMTTGKMICDPKVAGKVLRHAESFQQGIAKLSFVIPKTAKGKALKVKVTIKSGTSSTTKVTTFRVK
jgi:hypothetical protein